MLLIFCLDARDLPDEERRNWSVFSVLFGQRRDSGIAFLLSSASLYHPDLSELQKLQPVVLGVLQATEAIGLWLSCCTSEVVVHADVLEPVQFSKCNRQQPNRA